MSVAVSGGSLLGADRVADEALALLDGRRLVRAFPAYRAGLIESASFTPRVALRVTDVLAKVGERRR